MTIRKLQYAIDYIHVLTFKDHLKNLIAPYFDYDQLEYAIDNENTTNEGGRLIFRSEPFALQFKKDGVAFAYEGDVAAVKKSNPVNAEKGWRVSLDQEQLSRMQPVTDDLKEMLLNADYAFSMSIGKLPETDDNADHDRP